MNAGAGEPSDSTKPHVARPKNLAPKIDRNALTNIKIRAGQNFEFDVPVSGEPRKLITLFIDLYDLDTIKNIIISTNINKITKVSNWSFYWDT